MKRIIIALLACVAICFTACKKHEIPPVNGTINGMPALTLYGLSNNATDYVLIIVSTNPADRLISYQVSTYSYINSTGDEVYIEISPTNVVKGTLTTSGGQTVLTVVNTIPPVFQSSQYTSR